MEALILAGGKGERLRPLTDTIPKPMIRICKKPILEYQIDMLKDAGVTDVVLLVGHMPDVIYDYFKNGEDFGVNILYSYEDKPLGRGGAIKQGMDKINGDSFIVTNGDIVTDFPIRRLIKDYRYRSKSSNHIVSLLTTKMVSPYGIVKTKRNGIVSNFIEKPELPHTINAGIYVMNSKIHDLLPDIGDHESSTFLKLLQTNSISAVQNTEFWKSIDSFKDLGDAEKFIASVRN